MFIAINRINVPKGQGENLEKRFASSEGLKGQPGMLGFELLRRTWHPASNEQAAAEATETEEYMAVTRWETEEQFHAWTKSDAFKKAHGHGNKEKSSACASKSAEGQQQQADGAKSHGCGGGKMSASASGYTVIVAKEPQLV